MTYPGLPRRATNLVRYGIAAAVLVGLLCYLRYTSHTAIIRSGISQVPVTPAYLPDPQQNAPTPSIAEFEPQNISYPVVQKPPPKPPRPIDELIEKAEKSFEDILRKESHDLATAAAEYRKRRGRHPPPGFDVWFAFAQENNAVIVEDFFDQIYHDLSPFWGQPPAMMRREAWESDITINIRDQQAKTGSEFFWTQIWLNMIQGIEDMLPDMDLALNAMDEPRIVVPWEEMDRLMEIERSTRWMPPPSGVISNFQTLGPVPDPDVAVQPKNFTETRPFWQVAIRGCHPNSLARQAALVEDFNQTPTISLENTAKHTHRGYVSNFTLATDFCHQPDLQSLHGMMINPLSVSETKVLFPMFGGSKLPTNNEILLPAPMYWSNEERFTGGDDKGAPWAEKIDKAMWRGVATGGKNKEDNWKGFQRHRFVAMTNATKISGAESWTEIPENWVMPTPESNLTALKEHRLGEWTSEWSDTAFVDLMCDPPNENLTCSYTSHYFNITESLHMSDQFNNKYLPDIDGNSFSGRYRGLLMSTALPIKATLFREWHDSRLMPWVHFVPMDNRFMDFFGIIEYFLGYEGKEIKIPGRDEKAAKIAAAGQDWANKVLRKEDMQIYVQRLLLEYARVSDDRRQNMGHASAKGPSFLARSFSSTLSLQLDQSFGAFWARVGNLTVTSVAERRL
ncbi:hypothetical protein G7Y89_g12405 [Cudoniella acicularis]|uniref:Glycosyl transferase CAP10 domain-containing protein n=1 Tax=Cudoniella acicularis TaxID=354080 RepID=A0A8H4R956_9HELO|nr:hypothetical protein G7Y89_g12405 [Cudoniella acicularis]